MVYPYGYATIGAGWNIQAGAVTVRHGRYSEMRTMADAVSSNNASPSADLILCAILIMIGCALAINLEEISTTLFRNGTGFRLWRLIQPVR
jgi:hypothetical protein